MSLNLNQRFLKSIRRWDVTGTHVGSLAGHENRITQVRNLFLLMKMFHEKWLLFIKVSYFNGKPLLSIRMVPVNGKLTLAIENVSFREIVSPQISVAPAGFAIASASWDQTVLQES